MNVFLPYNSVLKSNDNILASYIVWIVSYYIGYDFRSVFLYNYTYTVMQYL